MNKTAKRTKVMYEIYRKKGTKKGAFLGRLSLFYLIKAFILQ